MAERRTQQKSDGGESQQQKDDSQGEDAKAPEPLPTTDVNREDGRFEHDYLIRNAVSLLGSRPAIVAGALARSERKTETIEQAKELLEKYAEQEHDPNAGIAGAES
jgi:hypothetical protein